MSGPLVSQLVLALVMLIAAMLAGAAAARSKLPHDRRHWSIEQSIFLVGACLGLIVILGGSR